MRFAIVPLAAVLLTAARAQTPPPPANALEQVLERLARLEAENRSLREQVQGLREEVAALKPAAASAAAPPPQQQLEERLAIQEKRTEEQAQIKVEASQRFPIRLSGMLLANAFHNSAGANGLDTPTTAARVLNGRQTGGLTFRQTVVGMEYTGSQTFLGATARGSLFADFFEGQTENNNFYPVRIRTGGFHLDWATRTLSVVQEKPLFSPRDPDSLSYGGISPLTAAGNLWRWQPQIRFEQRLGAPNAAGIVPVRAQVAVVQTNEDSSFDFATNRLSSERRRPGLQARVQLATGNDQARLELAPGFHVSEANVSGQRYRSDLVSFDWLVSPHPKFNWTGMVWRGQNVHHFGAFRQGFGIVNGVLRPVRSRGGWTQASVPITSRFSLNAHGGLHDDRNEDIAAAGIAVNRTGAVNFMYRIAPHIVVSLEAMKHRTTYRDLGNRSNNRYDLSIAYLF
ncbi:MAG: hypothetical protein IT162_17235 [Bryobacterales bacterium]|nr:hypothetical protein [Bryobacterales bacterium]